MYRINEMLVDKLQAMDDEKKMVIDTLQYALDECKLQKDVLYGMRLDWL